MLKLYIYIACLLGLCSLCPGCGDPPHKFAPVEGVVFINDKPQSGLLVRFMPDPQKDNDLPVNAVGETDQRGRFKLRYVYQGKEGQGAPVGWHRVLIEETALSRIPQGQPVPPRKVPLEYTSPATTPISKEVKPGPQVIEIRIE